MPHLLASIREDVAMVMEHDPAAKSRLEVLLCYSGLHAVWFYRVNHWLWNHRFFFWDDGCRKSRACSPESRFILAHRSDEGCSSTTAWAW